MYNYTGRPDAVAYIKGGNNFPYLLGKVSFYQQRGSVMVVADISTLPFESSTGFFALHIHEGDSCMGINFSKTGSHYNPTQQPHPDHAGDLPPLLRCSGGAYMAVRTDRFSVADIIGKTVVIHMGADDFTSQPAGNAGEKVACGVIARK